MPTATKPISIVPDNDIIAPKEAAALLQVEPQTLSQWRCNKRYALPFIKIGRLIRYRRSQVLAFIEQNTVGAA